MKGYSRVARRQPPHCQSGRSPAPWMTMTTGRFVVAPVGRDIQASGWPGIGRASKKPVIAVSVGIAVAVVVAVVVAVAVAVGPAASPPSRRDPWHPATARQVQRRTRIVDLLADSECILAPLAP